MESEERIFKSADGSAMCTDHKAENMLPGVLKRLQNKRSVKTSNPHESLHQTNSRIARSASTLKPYKGTVFCADFIKKHKYAYEAHLQRIGHFLVQGEGAWWHRASDDSVCFHDGSDNDDFSDAGPELLHFRNADLQHVLRRSHSCWQDAIDEQVLLPIEDVWHYDSQGDVTVVVSEPRLCKREMSLDDSFTVPTVSPPLQSSTPVRQQDMCNAASVPPQVSYEHHAMPAERESTQDAESVQPMETEGLAEVSGQPTNTEGFVDMTLQVESQDPQGTLQSSVCKAVARVLGISKELFEFDCVWSKCKDPSRPVLPVDMQRHRSLVKYFRKLIFTHKRGLEQKLAQLSPDDAEYNMCVKDVRYCLKLMCSSSLH